MAQSDSVLSLARALRTALVSFRAEAYSAQDCAALVEELAAVEKVCVAARARTAAHAGSCGLHREQGFAKVSDWMARATGSTAGAAKAALDTVAALESQPAARAALERGELSIEQAKELVRTEAVVPGSTADLLDVAKSSSLRALKDQARDRRLRAISPEELHALQHSRMHHRHWTTAIGTIRYEGELPPEFGIPFTNRLDAEIDRLWRKAYETGKRGQGLFTTTGSGEPATSATVNASKAIVGGTPADHGDAGESSAGGAGGRAEASAGGSGSAEIHRSVLAAQAFVRMFETGGGKGKANRADMIIVCDLDAYRRGHTHSGEVCHIVGGSPIPVPVAKELSRDAFLKAVLYRGTEVHTIAHFGRRHSAILKTALELGPAPTFNGTVCAAPGCGRRYHLQADHIDPVANGGPTSYANSQPLCPPDHRLKTERDRKAGLLTRRPPRTAQSDPHDQQRHTPPPPEPPRRPDHTTRNPAALPHRSLKTQ